MRGSDASHERFMREALAEAEAAGEAGQLPIGAVLVLDGQVVSRGRNRYLERNTQLAHAELEALLAKRSGHAMTTASSSRRSSRARCASAPL